MNNQEIIQRISNLCGNKSFFNIHLNEEESIIGITYDDDFFLKTDLYNKTENKEIQFVFEDGKFEIIEYDAKSKNGYEKKRKCSLQDFLSEVDKILKRAEYFKEG